MRWTKVFLLALVAGLFAVPGVVQAQGRADALVVVTEVGPNMLDIHAPGANRPSYQSSWNIYDRLLTFGSKTLKDGSRMYDYASLKPELAESWQVAPDGMSVTFRLRKDAKFHDGSPVTAHDVKWSFDRAVTVGGFPTFQMKAGSLEKPEQFEAVDDYTFRVKFVRKDKLSMPDLGVPVAVVINSKLAKQHATPQDPWAVEWVKQNDAGGGAYKIESWRPGQETVYARFEDWKSGPLPKIRRVIVREIPSAGTRRAMSVTPEPSPRPPRQPSPSLQLSDVVRYVDETAPLIDLPIPPECREGVARNPAGLLAAGALLADFPVGDTETAPVFEP